MSKHSKANTGNAREFDARAPKTKDAHEGAIKKWDEFANQQEPKEKPFRYFTQDYVCGRVLVNGSLENANNPPICSLMARFTSWIFEYKKSSGAYLKPDVAVQILSLFKTSLFKKFKPLGYQSDKPDWYVQMWRGLNNRACARAIAMGEKITTKAVGFSRATLSNACLWLLEQPNEARGCEERCILATFFHLVARGGEVSTST